MIFKSNKGITITSLIIYIIVLSVVIGLMSNFSEYFFKNMNNIAITENNDEQSTRFLAFITRDTNSKDVKFINTGISEQEIKYVLIKFEDDKEHQYLCQNEKIYYLEIEPDEYSKIINKKIELCNNVNSCEFEYHNNILTINYVINDKNYSKTLKIGN